jgi:hypothetical protein
MKKIIFGLLFVGLVSGLEAQMSLSEFKVYSSEYILDFETWRLFESYVTGFISYVKNRDKPYARLVEKLTPFEEQIVSLANQQIARSTSIGSAWLVYIGHRYSALAYLVFFYSDPDGERYYLMVRSR